jgi:hypothetical protein
LAASEAAGAVGLAQGLTFAAVLAGAATGGAVVGAASASLLQGLGVAVELASAEAFTAAGVLSLLPQPPSESARAEVATNRIERFIIGIFPKLCALFTPIFDLRCPPNSGRPEVIAQAS